MCMRRVRHAYAVFVLGVAFWGLTVVTSKPRAPVADGWVRVDIDRSANWRPPPSWVRAQRSRAGFPEAGFPEAGLPRAQSRVENPSRSTNAGAALSALPTGTWTPTSVAMKRPKRSPRET